MYPGVYLWLSNDKTHDSQWPGRKQLWPPDGQRNAVRGLTSVKCFREVLKPCQSENSISRKCCQTGFQVRVSSNIYIAKKLVLLGLGTMGAFFCFHESDNSLQLSNRRCFFKKELGQLEFKLNQETSGRGTENFIR